MQWVKEKFPLTVGIVYPYTLRICSFTPCTDGVSVVYKFRCLINPSALFVPPCEILIIIRSGSHQHVTVHNFELLITIVDSVDCSLTPSLQRQVICLK